jgi:hypothetical protein
MRGVVVGSKRRLGVDACSARRMALELSVVLLVLVVEEEEEEEEEEV